MTLHELKVQVALGEESRHQFKLARRVSLMEGSEEGSDESSEKILALIRIESALAAHQMAISWVSRQEQR